MTDHDQLIADARAEALRLGGRATQAWTATLLTRLCDALEDRGNAPVPAPVPNPEPVTVRDWVLDPDAFRDAGFTRYGGTTAGGPAEGEAVNG